MSSSPSRTRSTSATDATASTSSTPAVEVVGVTRRYGRGADEVTALGPVDLEIAAGEFVVLVGASGCGKSTLLRLIAGFEDPSTGTVTVAGSRPEPGRHAGLVFQQPRLLPWRTVGSNVELALRYAGLPKAQRAERREALLHRVGLEGIAHRRIWEISGGQQQRVAIARALAVDSSLLLLDEPFAALDALTRERLQEDLRQVSAETGRTSVFVTHSVDEAVFLGSRIVVLTKRPGQIVLDLEVDLPRTGLSPDELRARPAYAEARSTVSHAVRSAAA